VREMIGLSIVSIGVVGREMMVLIIPNSSTIRITLFMSPMKKLPRVSPQIACGKSKVAELAGPPSPEYPLVSLVPNAIVT
jgi:hypothetical protein